MQPLEGASVSCKRQGGGLGIFFLLWVISERPEARSLSLMVWEHICGCVIAHGLERAEGGKSGATLFHPTAVVEVCAVRGGREGLKVFKNKCLRSHPHHCCAVLCWEPSAGQDGAGCEANLWRTPSGRMDPGWRRWARSMGEKEWTLSLHSPVLTRFCSSQEMYLVSVCQ